MYALASPRSTAPPQVALASRSKLALFFCSVPKTSTAERAARILDNTEFQHARETKKTKSTPIICADARSWPLLSDHAAERRERPIATRLGACLPETGERNRRTRLQRAWRGTGWDGVARLVILPVETVPGEAGTTPPASGAPLPQPRGAVSRIDQGELQVQSVCVLGTSPTLPIADSVAVLMPDALPFCAWPPRRRPPGRPARRGISDRAGGGCGRGFPGRS